MSYSLPPNAMPTPAAAGPAPPANGPLAPPSVDMRSSPEMRAWLEQLQRQDQKLGLQNRALAVALAIGVAAALIVLWVLFRSTVGAYAAIDGLTAEQHPASPGRIDFAFRVNRPGQVHYQRSSGVRVTEMIDRFHTAGDQQRSWSWGYTPGEDLVVTAWYRSGFVRRSRAWRFPTTRRLDIVVLIDTSQSMGASIQPLKNHCTAFAERVLGQGWQPRFAVVAFGSREAEPWLYREGPTDDILEFFVAVDEMPRFPDGPDAGSSLDALEEALALPLAPGATRRFFLVTDSGFHPQTARGTTAAQIARQLADQQIRLDVFSRPEVRTEYEPLLGTAGRFYPLRRFGQWMNQGHVLED